jgi:O-acetylserine/cysteine efflux transporter
MHARNNNAILALLAAGTLWGLTVALSKLSIGWLGPYWLTVARFVIAAPVLALMGRRGLRDALRPGLVLSGAIGFGVVILLQNAGIQRTSVSHAAMIVGAVPVIVALITAARGHGSGRPLTWVGYGLALLGIVLVAHGGGGGATMSGDLLVLASVTVSGAFIAVSPQLLHGRDPAAVTAVQFGGGALVSLPVALLAGGGVPHAPASVGQALAFVALATVGTVLPFWLFAYGQARVPAQLAGVFVNFEPVVGAVVGWVAFGDPVSVWQLLGTATVIVGIACSAAPGRRTARIDQTAQVPSVRIAAACAGTLIA